MKMNSNISILILIVEKKSVVFVSKSQCDSWYFNKQQCILEEGQFNIMLRAITSACIW